MGKRIKIEAVPVSWPHLFNKQIYEGKETKYNGTFLVEKNDPVMKEIGAEIMELMKEKGVEVPRDKWCVKDGDETDFEANHGFWLIKAGSHDRPALLTKDGKVVYDDNGEFYPGAIVDAYVSFWVNTKGERRVVGELHGVQKVEDGPRLAGVSKKVIIEEMLGTRPMNTAGDFDDPGKQEITDGDIPF